VNELLLLLGSHESSLERVSEALVKAGWRTFHGPMLDEGLRLAYRLRPDLILAWIESGEEPEWEVCRLIRDIADAPLVLVIASDKGKSVTKALRLGVEAYFTTPVCSAELVRRVKTLLERTVRSAAIRRRQTSFVNGDLTIDFTGREVRRGDRFVGLAPAELRLISYMIEREGEFISRDELVKMLWGGGGERWYPNLSALVYDLRQKIEKDPRNPNRLVTRYGAGYCYRRVPRPKMPEAGEE